MNESQITSDQLLELLLRVPENQEIYFDIPELFNTSDNARLHYMQLLFGLWDLIYYDEWTPEQKVKHIENELFELFNRFKVFLADQCDIDIILSEQSRVLEDVLSHLKTHSKIILDERLGSNNHKALFLLNAINRINIDNITELKQNETSEIISHDIGKSIYSFAEIRGLLLKRKPKEDIEDSNAMKKVLMLIELGIIEYIENKYQTNKSGTNKLLAALTGVHSDLIKRYINGYKTGKLEKKVNNHNNPATKENIEWLSSLFSEIKINIK